MSPFCVQPSIGATFDSRSIHHTMSYACLHFDAKTAIARTSIAAWNALMRADPVFGRYALSDAGRSTFIAAFTVISNNEWRVGDKLHRIDTPGTPGFGGPARTFDDGTMEWRVAGKIHRIGAPARIYPDGTEMWYERGLLHRIGGPACTFVDGVKAWYEHGVRIVPAYRH